MVFLQSDVALAVLLWVFWCTLHSFLICRFIVAAVQEKWPRILVWYRLGYNVFSLATLLPVVIFTRSVEGEPVFVWDGYWIVPRLLLLMVAGYLFYAGAGQYDMQVFLGIRQIREKNWHGMLSDDGEFVCQGIFSVTRHPWYLGSLFFVWSALPEYSPALFSAAVVLSAYLVVGTYLEERKILAAYPVSYSMYQKKVSMLLPWKWLGTKIRIKNGR